METNVSGLRGSSEQTERDYDRKIMAKNFFDSGENPNNFQI